MSQQILSITFLFSIYSLSGFLPSGESFSISVNSPNTVAWNHSRRHHHHHCHHQHQHQQTTRTRTTTTTTSTTNAANAFQLFSTNEYEEQMEIWEEKSLARRDFATSLVGGMASTLTLASTSLPLLIEPGLAVAADAGAGADTDTDADIEKRRIFLRGTVELQPGVTIPVPVSAQVQTPEYGSDAKSSASAASKAALYITARPNNTVDVPRAILDGSNGKAPPVLAARIPISNDSGNDNDISNSNAKVKTFPLSFKLTELDLTVEGNAFIEGSGNGKYWWEGMDLVVSTRFDSDGVAATRDPTDLVGRGLYVGKSNDDVSIQLQGRGFTGKLFTGKSSK